MSRAPGSGSSYPAPRTRRERSAGVILYHEPSSGERLFLLLDYGRYWDFPKGHLEPGETDQQAAIRELHEESGITDCVLHPDYQREISYFFRAGGQTVHKTVVFFLGQTQTTTVTLSHEHVGWAFAPYDEALKRLKYPAARDLLRHARELIGVQ